ncbi:S-adenosyl-L-methionine-dependent methyltransferase [Aspergillus pseudotamarii]|uniref:S-adenosyl-L-methionine-dependent methyltransferase n=1 Tax=Aspergillus pseudotamarii TaxID=132259 RepID=A0A5N6SWU9_ASPPS|nr:S-adenosyl-L-methionine-dependent methyltransferase [Aspergillus pseudotamarii]KAE8139156.1 S-adenosyl-L-methionine-dependent methyltransferase [Aspergillus pseudotamarii]
MSSTPTQNIYDDPKFFKAYSTLPRSQHGFDAAPEWPVLQEMVLKNNKPRHHGIENEEVLDLGCGYGWFTRWARKNGAKHVKGIDVSTKMIETAKESEKDLQEKGNILPSYGTLCYEVDDLETISFSTSETDSYDLVYSSLTFHYIEDFSKLLRQIRLCLKKGVPEDGSRKGGRLIFSVEHPICTAPVNPEPDWKVLPNEDGEGVGRKIWPLNTYSDEGPRVTSWLGVDGVRKYHRTVETYVTALLQNGFVLTGLKDWVPSEHDVEEHPEWKDERHRPYFLLISAEVHSDY